MTLRCGFSTQYSRIPALSKTAIPWPLGRIEISESELVVYTPIPIVGRRVYVPYDEITDAIVRKFVRSGGSVRLRLKSRQRGDVRIATLDDGYLQIIDVLSQHDIAIRDEDPPTSLIIRRPRP
ncbi:MAG TPA: hypothetical protein VME22_21905 [Solirubrobacteraceae bacterium]|nr:hypothetical protein [Solirubrobacteraceae bacterium]